MVLSHRAAMPPASEASTGRSSRPATVRARSRRSPPPTAARRCAARSRVTGKTVSPGDQLPPVVQGPAHRDLGHRRSCRAGEACTSVLTGSRSTCSPGTQRSASRTRRQPGATRSACTGTSRSRGRWACRARTTTAPSASRWLGHLVTNWMGDTGRLQRLNVQVRRHNLIGDVTWCRGRVDGQARGGRGRPLVDLDLHAVTATGARPPPQGAGQRSRWPRRGAYGANGIAEPRALRWPLARPGPAGFPLLDGRWLCHDES